MAQNTVWQVRKHGKIYQIRDLSVAGQIDEKISLLVGQAPEALDTIYEIASAIGEDNEALQGLLQQVGSKANSSDVYTKNQVDTLLSEIELTPGPKGDTGEKGDKGDKGDTGETGPAGAKGDTGEKGDAFTYEDFTSEQLEALKGPKGDTGAQGPKGDTGTFDSSALEAYATKQFVSDRIAEVVGEAPETLDTLKEIADALQDNATMTNVTEAISTKANSEDVFTKTEINAKIGSLGNISEAVEGQPAIYSFSSFGKENNAAYGTGTVKVISQEDGWTTVEVITNEPAGNTSAEDAAAFVGQQFKINATELGEDSYELYSNDAPTDIMVSVELVSAEVPAQEAVPNTVKSYVDNRIDNYNDVIEGTSVENKPFGKIARHFDLEDKELKNMWTNYEGCLLTGPNHYGFGKKLYPSPQEGDYIELFVDNVSRGIAQVKLHEQRNRLEISLGEEGTSGYPTDWLIYYDETTSNWVFCISNITRAYHDVDLKSYYVGDYVFNKLINSLYVDAYTKNEINNKISTIESSINSVSYRIPDLLSDLTNDVGYTTVGTLHSYLDSYTPKVDFTPVKDKVDTLETNFSTLLQGVLDNELVIALALSDLETKYQALLTNYLDILTRVQALETTE